MIWDQIELIYVGCEIQSVIIDSEYEVSKRLSK